MSGCPPSMLFCEPVKRAAHRQGEPVFSSSALEHTMSTDDRLRQPQGTPAGGQFAPDPSGAQAAPVCLNSTTNEGLEGALRTVGDKAYALIERSEQIDRERAETAVEAVALIARDHHPTATTVTITPQYDEPGDRRMYVSQILDADGNELFGSQGWGGVDDDIEESGHLREAQKFSHHFRDVTHVSDVRSSGADRGDVEYDINIDSVVAQYGVGR